MDKSKIVFESLSDFVNKKGFINEAFNSSNLAKFDKIAKTGKTQNSSYSIEHYLNKGLFYNSHQALKPDQLTDDNCFIFFDVQDAKQKVYDLVNNEKKDSGILVYNEQLGINSFLNREFVNSPDEDYSHKDVFLVFCKSSDVDNIDRNKPKPSNKYNWHGQSSSALGNMRASEFKERRAHNSRSEADKTRMDDYVKKNNKAGYNSVKDQISGMYPKDHR